MTVVALVIVGVRSHIDSYAHIYKKGEEPKACDCGHCFDCTYSITHDYYLDTNLWSDVSELASTCDHYNVETTPHEILLKIFST